MNSAIADLPLRSAIAVVLSDVGYTNAMPDWLVPKKVDYSARQSALATAIDRYLQGAAPPKPFAVLVPRKRAKDRAKWLQISVNDQMILQACVSALAPKINSAFRRDRVFSYRYNSNPNSLRLTEDTCSGWDEYVQSTTRRAKSCKHVMLLDLEQSFATIDRAQFWDYLGQFTTGIELKVLQTLLVGLSPGTIGLPLINDSMFFLGNAYLSVVDDVVAKHTANFHRFVDDYCIFGASQNDLENLHKSIKADLEKRGFQLNEIKTNIVPSQQYCDRLSQLGQTIDSNNLDDSETDAYVPVPAGVDPNIMVSSLRTTVENPDQYLNDGTGRAQLATLRRLRDSLPNSARLEFSKDLCESSEVLQGCIRLLRKYAEQSVETWRSVWVLYLMKDVHPESVKSAGVATSIRQTLQNLQNTSGTPEVVKLWAKAIQAASRGDLFEPFSSLDYVEAGRRYCGA